MLTEVTFCCLLVVIAMVCAICFFSSCHRIGHEGWTTCLILPTSWQCNLFLHSPQPPPGQGLPLGAGHLPLACALGGGTSTLHDGWLLDTLLPCGWLLRLWSICITSPSAPTSPPTTSSPPDCWENIILPTGWRLRIVLIL